MTPAYDVAVVGFGPVGATCAGLLGSLGLRTLAIDRSRDIYDKPRAFALDHEIMRVFQQLGAADDVQPHTAPFTPSEYRGVDGQLIKRLGSVPPPYPLGWPPNMVFTQPPVEAAVRRRAAAFPGVEVALGTTLVSLGQSADAVELALQDDSGAARTATARYVIGCDGASSTVRTLCGMTYDDLQFDEPWLVVDVRVNDRGAARLPDVATHYCDAVRPATFLIGPGNHRRWEVMLLPGEDLKTMADEQQVWRLLSRWITPADAALWRMATYRFHALVASEWRRGRVFIAGDAAHQQPPFTGQGLCQGVRDVANLAWKLQWVLRGAADDRLLDTYAAERGAHVRRYTTLIKGLGRIICELDPAAAGARDRKLLDEAGGAVRTVPRQHLLPPLETGFIAGDGHPANGTIFPQPRVRTGRGAELMDAACGNGFRVVVDGRFPLSVVRRRDLLERLDAAVVRIGGEPAAGTPAGAITLAECDGVMADWFERYRCAAVIVRPDNYVYGVATNAAGLEAQLERAGNSLGQRRGETS